MAAATPLRPLSNPTAAFYREILDIDPGLTAAEKRTLQAEIAALEGQRPAGTKGKSVDAPSAAADPRPAAAPSPAAATTADAKPRLSRAEQSRINGGKSRGPTSMDGKLASCMNAFQHGLRARPGLLPDEDPAAFAAFVEDVFRELSPASALQRQLVQRAAEMAWRLQRLPLIERQILSSAADATGTPFFGSHGIDDLLVQSLGVEKDGVLVRLQRYGTRIERSLQSCIRELRALQKNAAQQLPAGDLANTRSAIEAMATGATAGSQPIVPPSAKPTSGNCERSAEARRAVVDACHGVVGKVAGSGSLGADAGATVAGAAGAVPAALPALSTSSSSPLGASSTPLSSDGMRFSGSFGAAAAMPMPVTALPVDVPAIGSDAAVSGSFGQTVKAAKDGRKAASNAPRRPTPADWPKGTDVLPTFAAM